METINYLKFPLKVDGQGQIGTQAENDYIRGLIEQVIFTDKRSRVNRPTFGVSIHKVTFGTLNAHVMNGSQDLIQSQLQQSLGHLITVNNVEVIESETTMKINIAYTINTNQNTQLVSYQRSINIANN